MEREKLFYDLHQTIKEVSRHEESAYSDFSDKISGIRKLTGEISQIKEENLSIVLDIYSKLPIYTLGSIEFIIRHASELKDIFYKDGEFIEKNLPLLYKPYIKSLIESPIITLYCFNNNISSNETWNSVLLCVCCRGIPKKAIENLILGNPVSNVDIINSLELLFKLNEECVEFAEILNEKACPLHKMQMDIYNGTNSPFKEDERKKYIKFLRENINDEDNINRVIEYINTHEYTETTTLKDICNLDVKYSDEFKSSCDTGILLYPDFKRLYKEAPKIAQRLSELYSTKKIELNEFTNLVNRFLKFDESERELIEKLL